MSHPDSNDPRLIDHALGELRPEQREEVESLIDRDEDARRVVGEVRRVAGELDAALTDSVQPSADLRQAIEKKLDDTAAPTPVASRSFWSLNSDSVHFHVILVVGIMLLALPASFIVMGWVMEAREAARRSQSVNNLKQIGLALHSYNNTYKSLPPQITEAAPLTVTRGEFLNVNGATFGEITGGLANTFLADEIALKKVLEGRNTELVRNDLHANGAALVMTDGKVRHISAEGWGKIAPNDGRLNLTGVEGKPSTVWVDVGVSLSPNGTLLANSNGRLKVRIEDAGIQLLVTPRIIITEEEEFLLGDELLAIDRETYESIIENSFVPVTGQQALSTFSIDVDTASYSNVRRFLTNGQLPPADAVRIEELVNYFHYDYPQPQAGEPFSASMEVTECPWQAKHKLLRIGLKGREISREQRPASNLVFLIDVSGSMNDENKLPLLQRSMKLLVDQLDERDRVTIVTYAGDAGLRLEPTIGDKHAKINEVIDGLSSGGSTHGSAGIQMAYQKAVESFIDDGVNRVILATDGDLNVGITADEGLIELIKEKAQSSIFLTVLGFGMGNYQDAKLEKMADNGNGMYAYIDRLSEGRKVLVEQIAGSLVTIAKDVKIQVEFNPAEVASYRLIGYENRVMAAKDFDDDKKDAGEIGAGHTVTALYELTLVGEEPVADDVKGDFGEEPLKYQQTDEDGNGQPTKAAKSGELLTLKLRYKRPDADKSTKVDFVLKERGTRFNRSSKDFQFAAAVASFGMLLRDSEYSGTGSFTAIEEIATGATGKDTRGYRAEFVELVRAASKLK